EADIGPLTLRPNRHDGGLAVRSSDPNQFAHDRVARMPGQEVPAFVFEVDLPNAVETDLRPPFRGSNWINLVVLQFEVAEERQRLTRVAVVGACHPEDAGPGVELLARASIPLGPQRERPRRH